MVNAIWTPVLGWAAAVGAAVALAFAAPHERWLLGRLPNINVKSLDQRYLALPQELPSGRTLALVVFDRSQRHEVQSWIDGLQLHRNPAIAWLKMPVLNDPGDEKERRDVERRLLDRHPSEADRARLVPVFTDREAFARAAGLDGTAHASVLVVDRAGNVLARAQGPFDPNKAEALRATLFAQHDWVALR